MVQRLDNAIQWINPLTDYPVDYTVSGTCNNNTNRNWTVIYPEESVVWLLKGNSLHVC